MFPITHGLRRARLPWGLVGAFGIGLLVESWVIRHALELTPLGPVNYLFAGRACREARDYELICLGDSLVKHGVAPPVLETRLGRRTLNLACVGGISPLTYFLLERSLASGAHPRALLVDFKATQLQSNPATVERALAEVLLPNEWIDLSWAARDSALFGRLAVYGLLPSARARLEVRSWILANLGGLSNPFRDGNLVALRNWHVNSGAALRE